jgi:type IX secretion system PorP/SprF family membrane protein
MQDQKNNIKMKNIFLLLVMFVGGNLFAQDLQYSQFNSMPMATNPAFAGNSYCNYRISGIYRNQWMGSSDFKSYQSASFGGDFNLGKNSNDLQNIWGFGLIGNYDKTASNTFSNHSLYLNLAYHLRFGKNSNSFLSFGIQGGVGQRAFTPGNLIFDDQIDAYGVKYKPSTSESITNESNMYSDVNFGSLLTLNPSSALNIYMGASAFHLTQPNVSFSNQEFKLPTRINFHAGANYAFSDLYFLPSLYIQYQQVSNWNFGGYLGKTLKPETETTMPVVGYLGLWYKSTDAITPAFRMDLGSVSFVFSYDIHVGKISNNQGSIGSPELSVNYFGCFGRNSKRTGCPAL